MGINNLPITGGDVGLGRRPPVVLEGAPRAGGDGGGSLLYERLFDTVIMISRRQIDWMQQ